MHVHWHTYSRCIYYGNAGRGRGWFFPEYYHRLIKYINSATLWYSKETKDFFPCSENNYQASTVQVLIFTPFYPIRGHCRWGKVSIRLIVIIVWFFDWLIIVLGPSRQLSTYRDIHKFQSRGYHLDIPVHLPMTIEQWKFFSVTRDTRFKVTMPRTRNINICCRDLFLLYNCIPLN